MSVSSNFLPKESEVYRTPWSELVDQPRRRSAAPDDHLQGIDHQLGAQMTLHVPAYEPSRVGLKHKRQVEEALVDTDISEVCDLEPVWRYGAELGPHEVRGGDGTPIPVGSALYPPTETSVQPGFAHQPRHSLSAAADAHGLKLGMYPRRAVGPSAMLVDLTDLAAGVSVLSGSPRQRSIPPTPPYGA
jgi:hypothetical protein